MAAEIIFQINNLLTGLDGYWFCRYNFSWLTLLVDSQLYTTSDSFRLGVFITRVTGGMIADICSPCNSQSWKFKKTFNVIETDCISKALIWFNGVKTQNTEYICTLRWNWFQAKTRFLCVNLKIRKPDKLRKNPKTLPPFFNFCCNGFFFIVTE